MTRIKKMKILIVYGTRPEALKFVPLIKAFRASKYFDCHVCCTGQHSEMSNQVMKFFKIKVDTNLKLMQPGQSLEELSSRVITALKDVLKTTNPDVVFVQGDTTTAFMAGMAAFYAKKRLAHLEAGLRTWNKMQPFPEEMNRVLLSRLADLHFAPTKLTAKNLINEGIDREKVFQVGNTIVDTLLMGKLLIKDKYPIFKNVSLSGRILFVTAHRRESFGAGLEGIFAALKEITTHFKDVHIIYPVHMNPNVFKPAQRILGNISRIHLCRPLSYEETLWTLSRCYFVLTDSGGIQEEAPSFRKPVLILREVTERMEGVSVGTARLVGTDATKILAAASQLLSSPAAYRRMQGAGNLYGDGQSTKRILGVLKKIQD